MKKEYGPSGDEPQIPRDQFALLGRLLEFYYLEKARGSNAREHVLRQRRKEVLLRFGIDV